MNNLFTTKSQTNRYMHAWHDKRQITQVYYYYSIALYTLFHDPIFNTLSQFFSLLDINSYGLQYTITIYILLRFCPCTLILCFCFYLSLTRFLSQEKLPLVLLLKTNFPFPTMKAKFPSREREKFKKKRNCKCIYLNSVLQLFYIFISSSQLNTIDRYFTILI